MTKPVARGGSRGFGLTPPCSLANLYLMRQQQYRVQSFNCAVVLLQTTYKHDAAATRGIVTYMSPVEAFVTGIKNFDW